MSSAFTKGRYAQVVFAIPPEQLEQIDQIAVQQSSSRAAVLRQATEFFLSYNNRSNVTDGNVSKATDNA